MAQKTLQQVKNETKNKNKQNNNITDSDYVLREKTPEDILKNTINMTPSEAELTPEEIEKRRVIQARIEEEKAKLMQKEIDEAVAKGIAEYKAEEAKKAPVKKATEDGEK